MFRFFTRLMTIRKADEMVNSEMNKITGGLGGIPGLF